MEIKYSYSNSTLVLYFVGELDEHSAKPARERLDELIDSLYIESAIYELSELNFTDSTGIGLMLGRYKKLKNKGATVYIKSPKPNIEKVLVTSGLYQVMPKIG